MIGKPAFFAGRAASRAAVPTFLATLLATTPVAAAEEGEATFNTHCRTCHTTKQGDNRLGPSLYKIYGAKAGSAPGYGNYSQGLVNSGITWDEATLDKFIANPDSVIANNNMKPYKGIPDEATRAKIVAFLKSQTQKVAGDE